jgi:hypothetical protein
MAIGLKGIWEVKRKIEKVEASEGNIMHDSLTANGSHAQYLAGNNLTFIGTGVDPDEKRVMQFDKDIMGDYNVWFGHNHAERYSFPNEHGTSGQILQLSVGDPGALLNWADAPAGENLGTHDLTLTDNRKLYFDGSWLVFKDAEEGSESVLSLNALNMTIGGEETGWNLNLGRAGFEGMCLTEVVADGQSAWRYPFNPFNKTPEEGDGNIAMGVGVMSTFDGDAGDNNVVIGNGDAGSGITNASGNIYIGKDAGATLTGDDNIIVGTGSTGAATNTPLIMIGNGATATGNGQLHIGSTAHSIGPVAVDAVAGTFGEGQTHTIEVWFNEVCYYLSLKQKT